MMATTIGLCRRPTIAIWLGTIIASTLKCIAINTIAAAAPRLSVDNPDVDRNLGNQVRLVAIIGDKDDREVLSITANEIGFTKRDISQAMACTGVIRCVSPESVGWMSAGAICAPGRRKTDGNCIADRIATAAHMFVTDDKKRLRKLNHCEFTNYNGKRYEPIISDIKYGLQSYQHNGNYNESKRYDKIVFRLKTPISDCDPYDLTPNDGGLKHHQPVFALSYPHYDMYSKNSRFDGREPIAYRCSNKLTLPSSGSFAAVYITDCDAVPGASGSFLLSKRDGARFTVSAIAATASDEIMNYKPFDIKTNRTLYVATTDDFVAMAVSPGRFPMPKISGDPERMTTKPEIPPAEKSAPILSIPTEPRNVRPTLRDGTSIQSSVAPLYCDDGFASSGSAILLSTDRIAVLSRHLRDGAAYRLKCEVTFAGLPATSFTVPQTAEVAAADKIVEISLPSAKSPNNGIALYKGDPVATRLVAAMEGHPITERVCTAWQVPTTPSQADLEACKPESNESLLLADTKDGYLLIAIAGSKGQWVKVQ